MRSVAVTSLGVVSAFGVGVEPFRAGLLANSSAFAPARLFDPSPYLARRACEVPGVPPDPLGEVTERAHRLLLAAAGEALAGAEGILEGERSAIVLGTTLGGNRAFTAWLAGDPWSDASELSSPARLLARRTGVKGPVQTVSVACASGAAAIAQAAGWIRSGRVDRALAGGFDALSEFVFSGFDSLRALSAGTVRPFDVRRDGLGLGEGAGCLLLESAGAAAARGARPLAWLRGAASAADAFHLTRPSPEGSGLARALEAALRDAGAEPSAVDFVSAHGTATRLNDRMEAIGLASVFGERLHSLPIHSVKGAIGHTLGAAGAIEAALTVLVLSTGIVPPTAGFEEPDPECPLDVVAGAPRRLETVPRFAVSTSSAFAGTNAVLVLERA